MKKKQIVTEKNFSSGIVSDSDHQSSIGKNPRRMKESEYLRIKYLYNNWWSLLLKTALVYGYLYAGFMVIKYMIDTKYKWAIDNTLSVDNSSFYAVYVTLFFVLLQGVAYSADGIISALLKSPFGQICYAINKSSIENELADKMVTTLTEINEHFKETFKKFGIINIANMIIFLNISFVKNTRRYLKEEQMIWIISFLIPLVLAFINAKGFERLMDSIELVKDE